MQREFHFAIEIRWPDCLPLRILNGSQCHRFTQNTNETFREELCNDRKAQATRTYLRACSKVHQNQRGKPNQTNPWQEAMDCIKIDPG